MPRKKNPNVKQRPKCRGVPPRPIDWNVVDQMLESGCPGAEIAPRFNLKAEAFYDRVKQDKGMHFSEYMLSKKAEGVNNIRKQVYTEALGIAEKKGNTEMLKLLAEAWLGLGRKSVNINGFSREDLVNFILEENQSDSRIAALSRSSMENEPSLLDKRQSRQSDQIQSELGTERTVERSSSMQDSSESPSVGHNDVFMPPFP
jgi:hypothetical protein